MLIQAQGAKNGIELAFDTILKGRDGLTHRQKVMNKYLNIVDVAPIDGCDLITTIDVGMQDICEKALVDKLKEPECYRRCSRIDGSNNRRGKSHR